MNLWMYCLLLSTVSIGVLISQERFIEFPLFYLLGNIGVDSKRLQILTPNANSEPREVGRSNNMNFTETTLPVFKKKIKKNALDKLKEKLQKVRKLDMTWCNEYLIEDVEFNNSIVSNQRIVLRRKKIFSMQYGPETQEEHEGFEDQGIPEEDELRI
ncbi:hypothetical protein ABEB36_014073 [Hypothenemus hampei]|uniref:Uncharacterized protein n=1 Tax=Hypothenemus hampei TaxID=57062 RepID=A0ABD1E451_HYPHA